MKSTRRPYHHISKYVVLATIATFLAAMLSGCFGSGANGPGSIHVQGGSGGGGTAPAPPAVLTATAGDSEITLTWPASTGATSYNVYRGTSSGTETLYKSGVTTAGYTDTSVTNGTAYWYQVTAVNAAGESGRTNEATATPNPPPAAPTGLTATGTSGQVALTWNAVAGAIGYKVYRSTSSGTETLLASPVTTTSYTDTTVTNGTTYFYEVTAFDNAGESAKSNEASATP